MKLPHLLAAGLACLLLIAITAFALHEAHRYEVKNERASADVFFPQKINGSAMQRLAFTLPHYLPIYGSSELGSYELQKRVKTKPGDFFVTSPTGFVAFPVGRGGTTPLVMLEELAAIGDVACDHKVVIVLSPNWFTGPLNVSNYEGNAALLHIGSLFFGSLTDEFKVDAARRLARFPRTLEKSALLKLVTTLYANGGRWQLVLSKLLKPAGKCWLFSLNVLDNFKTIVELHDGRHQLANPPPIKRRKVNWTEVEVEAESVSNVEASWVGHDPGTGEPATALPDNHPPKVRKRPANVDFVNSDVWGDYELLLRELHEVGAKVLILSVPQDGPVQDKNGVPFLKRNIYYDRVHDLAAKYHFEARTFEEHEYDGNFLIEHVSHLTDKGWSYLDQTIDDFYHDRL